LESDDPAEALAAAVRQAASRYYRLVLVAGPIGSDKTKALESIGERSGASLVNTSLELSRQMLALPKRQRPLQLRPLLENLVNAHGQTGGGTVLLDNIELLFEAGLGQDPLHLLMGLSRNKTIVVSWPGLLEDGQLRYAIPNHSEYRRYATDELRDLTVVNVQAGKAL